MVFSYYKTIKDIHSTDILSFDQFLFSLQQGPHTPIVKAIRKLKSAGVGAKIIHEEKRKLPAVTISGTFRAGHKDEGIITHSGLLCLDFDGFAEGEAQAYKQRLKEDLYVFCSFLSASENLAVIIKIDPAFHRHSFDYADAYFYENYGLAADKTAVNESRLRYLSHDPEYYLNPGAVLFTVPDEYKKEKKAFEQNLKKKALHSSYSDFDRLIDLIEEQGKDIAPDYNDWIRIGFGIAHSFNGEGRDYFHRISSQHPGYDEARTNKQYDSILKNIASSTSQKTTSLKTIFYLAKEHGVIVKPEKSAVVVSSVLTKENEYCTVFQAIRNTIEKKYIVRFNELTQRIEVDNKQLTDFTINKLIDDVSFDWGKTVDKEKLKIAVNVDTWDRYHPIKEYIESLPPWDNKDRMKQMVDCMNTPHPDLAYTYLSKWMTGMIHCLYGRANTLILVLVGPIATGKTLFFQSLLPEALSSFFAETHLEPADRINNMNQNLIVFDEELKGISKMGERELRALSSAKKFALTRKWEAFETKLDRIASICGASNPKAIISGEFNRRITPILIPREMNFAEMKKIDREQLLSQAVAYFKTGNNFEIVGDEIKILSEHGSFFEKLTTEYELINRYFKAPDPNSNEQIEYKTATDILIELKEKSGLTNLSAEKIGTALNKLGFEPESKRNVGGRKHVVTCYGVVYSISDLGGQASNSIFNVGNLNGLDGTYIDHI